MSVFTTKDGKSSFYVSKEKASQPGAAYYRSMATRGVSKSLGVIAAEI